MNGSSVREGGTNYTAFMDTTYEEFRSVASRFNVSKSTCWDILQRTSKRLLNVNALYGIIKWPTEEEALLTMQSFERRSHFPGILGCIDGSHIKILAPQHSPNSYVNRKHFHSILVQGVCNHKRMFIDLYAGEPGSLHDSNLFSKSDLCERIENGTVQFYNNSHLVGDLAYKLSTSLIVGFKNLGNLTEMQINFNKKLNANRVEIENAFAFLKGRFRRLKYVETVRLDFVSLFTVTAAVLHNACIMNGDLPNQYVNLDEELEEERQNNAIDAGNHRNIRNNAIAKRLNIMHALPL
ncbi:hypothetical protein PPYR_04051 [Photinus pyralis]|uniref:DDE Tnp4 domain-containing protein n=1 Tax=Photinus pyralis TaxID=7054 RepID=A0A5N4AWY0_PHOPY|nr:hypothetical protein PPYR_04051 [Photinus pyralis]